MEKSMADERDIESIINMLDAKTQSGVSRIKVQVSEEQEQGTVEEKIHLGRCDITTGECD